MSDDVESELIDAIQGDRDALRGVARRLQQVPELSAEAMKAAQEQFDAAVRHRARGLLEKDRFDRHFPDILEDSEQYQAALKLDAEMFERYPNMSERERFTAVGEAVRRGFGEDVDRAVAIAAQKRHHGRAQEEAGSDEASHQPTREDLAIMESEADYQSVVSENMAAIVRGRGPQVLPPRTDAQRLADERRELERRRRAQGW